MTTENFGHSRQLNKGTYASQGRETIKILQIEGKYECVLLRHTFHSTFCEY
jgi:hypothetical protein